MSSDQVVVTLEDASGKEVRRTTTSLRGTCKFENLSPGRYRVYGTFPDGSKLAGKGGEHVVNKGEIGEITVQVSYKQFGYKASPTQFRFNPFPLKKPSQQPEEKPPWKAIASFAAGASLLSNFGGAEPLIREIGRQLVDDVPPPRSSPQNQTRSNLRSRTPQSQTNYNRLFSPSVEARLRACIQSNIVRLSGIPTLSSLLESLSWEREPSGEFERQLIFAYTRFQQVKALFEECDPTLIQEILAAQEEIAATDPQFQGTAVGVGEITPNLQAQATVTVIGSFINIRVGPSTQNAVLGQVTYGTVLGVDQATLALLSPSERLAISEGRGWLPIFIPDSRRGYIYSLYISPRP